EPGRALAAQTVAYLPSLLAALFIVAFGWLLAKFARLLVFRFLLIIRFDMASERAGVDDVLVKADIRQSPAELVAIMAQWAVGLALAFGLGCKDLARDWMVRYLDGARARRKSH